MALASVLAKRAQELHREGKYAAAVDVYRQVLKQQPTHTGVMHKLGQALLSMHAARAAADLFERILSKTPGDVAAIKGLSNAKIEMGDHASALELWTNAIARNPNSPQLQVEFAKTLRTLRRIDDSIAAWMKAAALDPNAAEPLVEAARLMLRTDRREEAMAALARALSIVANHDEANVLLGRIERQSGDAAAARSRLQRVMETGAPGSVGRASLELALLLEDAGDAAAAFAAAERGQQSLRSMLVPAAADLRPATQVIELCRTRVTREVVSKWEPPDADGRRDPVFVVGFPRSGTTLIEQMLSAHSGIVVTDELPLLQAVKDATIDRLHMRQQYPDSLSVLGVGQMRILRDTYFDAARRWLGDAIDHKRIVDKAPLNTVDLCLVRRLFPNAHVLVALRDPRDIVISCFFQAFTSGLPHLFGFESAADLYGATMRLWLHYREALELNAKEIRYEDVVADPIDAAKAMIDFLSEAWEPSVAKHHERARRYVSTPSYDDVARPVYASAVARWRKYRPQLERVRHILDPFVHEFGYSEW